MPPMANGSPGESAGAVRVNACSITATTGVRELKRAARKSTEVVDPFTVSERRGNPRWVVRHRYYETESPARLESWVGGAVEG